MKNKEHISRRTHFMKNMFREDFHCSGFKLTFRVQVHTFNAQDHCILRFINRIKPITSVNVDRINPAPAPIVSLKRDPDDAPTAEKPPRAGSRTGVSLIEIQDHEGLPCIDSANLCRVTRLQCLHHIHHHE